MDKMFVDVMGEVTVTKDGATLLRKIDVEHPAAKVIIEASNAVDNEVGDGTTSVVVLAGALVRRAEELLAIGIAPSTIIDGYSNALDICLKALEKVSRKCDSSDRLVMKRLVRTSLASKPLLYAGDKVLDIILQAILSVTDFTKNEADTDSIKIEEKQGNITDLELVSGVVIDKTIDSSSMPKAVAPARIILVDDDLEGKRTRTEAEIRIDSPEMIKSYSEGETMMIKSKVQHIVDSGANVVISRKGINTLAQSLLKEHGIISIRRVKENDLLWLAKATGARVSARLDHEHDRQHEHHHHHDHHYLHHDIEITLGHSERVYEKPVGDDRMVFVEGCKDPRAVTILIRANSKRMLDELHRSTLDAISVLGDFIKSPLVVAGGGATEAAIARRVRAQAGNYEGREQLVIQKFADALEEIPVVIAKNAGMNPIDTLVELRSRHALSNGKAQTVGVDAFGRKVKDMLPDVIEPAIVKEQVIKTAVEAVILLIRVDDVLMAKPKVQTHTHDDGTEHSHAGGDREHRHDHFDRLGKKQRQMHHYY